MSATFPRGSAIVGSAVRLGCMFSQGNNFIDVAEIVSVTIEDPNGGVHSFYTAAKESLGHYYIVIPEAYIQSTGVYYDTWNYRTAIAGPIFQARNSFFVDQVAVSSDAMLNYTKFLRIVLGDNNPLRYRRNPMMDGVDRYATTPNLIPYDVGYKWSDEELQTFIVLSQDYINTVYGMTKTFELTNHPAVALLIRGAHVLAIRAKGHVELNEFFDLSDGGAQLNLNRYTEWHSQADSMEQAWKEDVKMFKYKYRPRPLGIATTSGFYGLPGLFQELPSYLATYGFGYMGFRGGM